MRELAENLRCSITELERELLNLVQRQIVTYVCQGRIKWTSSAAHAMAVINILAKDISILIQELGKKKPGILNGEPTFEDLVTLWLMATFGDR